MLDISVVLDKEDNPLSVSSTHRNEQNIIMWMDHRAFVEADFANATNAPVLDHVGGALSVEMQIPKLLWLKKVGHFSLLDVFGSEFELYLLVFG